MNFFLLVESASLNFQKSNLGKRKLNLSLPKVNFRGP